MTASSELFVDETVRDSIPEKIRKKLGKHQLIVPQNWKNIWCDSEFPNNGEAAIVDDGDNIIAKVSWDTKFDIEAGQCGTKEIHAEPENVKVSFVEKPKILKTKENIDKCSKFINTRPAEEKLIGIIKKENPGWNVTLHKYQNNVLKKFGIRISEVSMNRTDTYGNMRGCTWMRREAPEVICACEDYIIFETLKDEMLSKEFEEEIRNLVGSKKKKIKK